MEAVGSIADAPGDMDTETGEFMKELTACAYMVGEELFTSLKRDQHLLGLTGKKCVLRDRAQVVSKQFEQVEKLLRKGDADLKHVLLEVGMTSFRDEEFRPWRPADLGKEIIDGLERLLANANLTTVTWVNLPEKGDLVGPIVEVNKMVEDWIEKNDATKVSLLNLRGIHQNKLLFDGDRLTKPGGAEAAKKIVT